MIWMTSLIYDDSSKRIAGPTSLRRLKQKRIRSSLFFALAQAQGYACLLLSVGQSRKEDKTGTDVFDALISSASTVLALSDFRWQAESLDLYDSSLVYHRSKQTRTHTRITPDFSYAAPELSTVALVKVWAS